MAAPIVGTRSVPTKVRLIIVLVISSVVILIIEPGEIIEPLSFEGLVTTIQQVLIGVAMGFTVRVVFIVLEMASQLIGQLMGLMMASTVGPTNGNRAPIIGQFYLLLITLFFLSIDGHLIMIEAIAQSFDQLPVASCQLAQVE